VDDSGLVEDASGGKRIRTPGVRYPGASLKKAEDVLTVLDAAGGTATVGTMAVRAGMSESSATFVRLVASVRSYGLADWANASRSALRLTADGEAAVSENTEAKSEALGRAALRPDVFQRVARKLEGRAVPTAEGLAEAFVVAGVAPSGAKLAADNFVESLTHAGLISQVGDRRLLNADLPYPEPESGSGAAPAVARAGAQARPAPRPNASRVAAAGSPPEVTLSSRTTAPRQGQQPSVHIDVQVHIDPAATAEQIDQIFASMARHLYDRE
jgi:hypothetical protein